MLNHVKKSARRLALTALILGSLFTGGLATIQPSQPASVVVADGPLDPPPINHAIIGNWQWEIKQLLQDGPLDPPPINH